MRTPACLPSATEQVRRAVTGSQQTARGIGGARRCGGTGRGGRIGAIAKPWSDPDPPYPKEQPVALGTRIVSLGHYQPSRVLTNAELEGMVETSDAWIRSRV